MQASVDVVTKRRGDSEEQDIVNELLYGPKEKVGTGPGARGRLERAPDTP